MIIFYGKYTFKIFDFCLLIFRYVSLLIASQAHKKLKKLTVTSRIWFSVVFSVQSAHISGGSISADSASVDSTESKIFGKFQEVPKS